MAYQIDKEINFSLASWDENISRRNTQWKKPSADFVKINTGSFYIYGNLSLCHR
jgi:hypothetical protein